MSAEYPELDLDAFLAAYRRRQEAYSDLERALDAVDYDGAVWAIGDILTVHEAEA